MHAACICGMRPHGVVHSAVCVHAYERGGTRTRRCWSGRRRCWRPGRPSAAARARRCATRCSASPAASSPRTTPPTCRCGFSVCRALLLSYCALAYYAREYAKALSHYAAAVSCQGSVALCSCRVMAKACHTLLLYHHAKALCTLCCCRVMRGHLWPVLAWESLCQPSLANTCKPDSQPCL
jgi:hypothetical protein